MKFNRLGPGFAVEVVGIDPASLVSDTVVAELKGLLDQHELLVLHAPKLDAKAHMDFLALFGRIYDEGRDGTRRSYVSNVLGGFPNGRLLFHQDSLFTPYPHPVQSLYAEEVQGAVSPTLFVSNSQAYERLTAAQREAWRRLNAVHARNAGKSGAADDEFTRVELLKLSNTDDTKVYPRAIHPVIKLHPRTGKPLLIINEYYTSHIVELPPEAGEKVIQDAYALMYAPEYIYAHQWRVGDLVIWDNIALQHARAEVKPDTRRTLRRVLVNDHLE